MAKRVYIVTSRELGWDCIVHCYDPEHITMEELLIEYPIDSEYIIFDKELQKELFVED